MKAIRWNGREKRTTYHLRVDGQKMTVCGKTPKVDGLEVVAFEELTSAELAATCHVCKTHSKATKR